MTPERKFLFYSISLIIFLIVGVIWGYIALTRPISCDSFIDKRLQVVDFTNLKPGMEMTWINQHFPLLQWGVKKSYALYIDEVVWQWTSFKKKYQVRTFEQSIHLRQIWRYSLPVVGGKDPRIDNKLAEYSIDVKVEDMLHCLGEPDAYLNIAFQGPDAYLQTISFFYKKEGYIFTGQGFFVTQSLAIRENTSLLFVDIVPVGSPEDMIKNVYATEPETYQNQLIEAIKIWPENITKIEQLPIITRDEQLGR